MTVYNIDSLRIKRFCELTGWTEQAVRSKIKKGIWKNGREYHKAPDGNIVVSLTGYEQWIAQNKQKIPRSLR